MGDDPTVLSMINDNLNSINTNIDEIKRDMKSGAVTMGKHDVRLGHIEDDVKSLKKGQKKIKESVYNHANDKKVHYNQGYKETFKQRAWRKKGEIGITSLILGIITLIIQHYGG